ncbi:MAG: FAD-dependent monooxygenase [Gammaproteobacteria bacterium]|nr:MAG: FAD-dependent monooxygenase [Gammaproteobacteria bacterium]
MTVLILGGALGPIGLGVLYDLPPHDEGERMESFDVAIVGGGLGGSALGGYLARAGLDVVVLERLTAFSDRVRGEWMAPWGAAELKKLGLYERFITNGGHHLATHIAYDELLTPDEAEARAFSFGGLHPDVPGPLCMEHVAMQDEALAQAIEAGVDVRRGVSKVEVTAGEQPRVLFEHDGARCEAACRLIVGADGRTSAVRRQLGIRMEEAPIDHLIAGLLVDGAEGWPEDLQTIGKCGDIHYLVFPQGGGKIRIYADYAYSGAARFNGDEGAQELLAAFDMEPVPHSDAVANARPIGPCRSFPSQDAWVDEPCVEGAVLIGDAAGYNDPILGQGLSMTLRDARMVGELMTQNDAWRTSLFEPYVDERRERLRRLRYLASFVTTLNARFGPEDLERRAVAFQRMADNPTLGMVYLAAFTGPESLPAECFTEDFYASVFGTTEHLIR